MSWFLVILFLSLTWNGAFSSEVRTDENKKLPSAVIVGTVYCDTCFQESFSMTSHFISGAYVAVEYQDGNSMPEFRKEVKTNEHGEFRVQLPSSISKHLKKIKGCAVKLVNSSDPYCSVVSSATSSSSSSIHLKSRKHGEHIFSAGFFSFKPLQQPTLCNQKLMSTVNNSKGLDPVKKSFLPPTHGFKFPSPLQNPIPTMPGLPPLPRLPELPPLPQLPPLPRLPRLPVPLFPFPPFPGKSKQSIASEEGKDPSQADFFFPPNPLQPPLVPNPLQPPLVPNPLQPPPLIPNPFQPPPLIPNPFQPPPSPLIPNPFQPPPAPLIPNPFQPPPAPFLPNPFQPPPAPPAPVLPNPFQPPPAPPAPFLPLFPPIPGFTPSPPPPPPPSFPFIPLPPLFPGRPPVSPSTERSSP